MSQNVNIPDYLEKMYENASVDDNLLKYILSKKQMKNVDLIVKYEETFKGVFTCVISSLFYKHLNPLQDVRYHKIDLPNGYSGRSFDTKYVTPFLKKYKFAGAMKESGWLTRSIEQDAPFNLDFPGKIRNEEVKSAFLDIMNDIYLDPSCTKPYLMHILNKSIKENKKRQVLVVNPVISESRYSIETIITILKKHFYYNYSCRGASILPVLAIYSIYQCLCDELKRFNDKKLEKLASHTSCDKSSGNTGDIVVKYINGNMYEVVEVKFDIAPNRLMIEDAYKKFSNTTMQRYYILSTVRPSMDEYDQINDFIYTVENTHGCQIICDDIFMTLTRYLRLLSNTDNFIFNYVKNLQNNEEIPSEHKNAWNTIITQLKK